MSQGLSSGTRRLFPHYRDAEDLATAAPDFLMIRIMEEGDRTDLRWLTQCFPEAEIARCFDRLGLRQLSRRSRAFWRLVLDRETQTTPSSDALWPL